MAVRLATCETRAVAPPLSASRAAAETAVDDDLGVALHRGDDLRQHVHGAHAVVELATAVIGDVHHVDAVLDAERGVFGGEAAETTALQG